MRIAGEDCFSLKLLTTMRPKQVVAAATCASCPAHGIQALDLPAIVQSSYDVSDALASSQRDLTPRALSQLSAHYTAHVHPDVAVRDMMQSHSG